MRKIFLLLLINVGYAERPNVLLLLVDDLRPALGAYGDKAAKTPHMDALAAAGMRFDSAYCNTAVCAPSRFNLLTGARSTSLGIYAFGENFRKRFPDAVTMPQYFMQHGYHTQALGKVFHIGHGCDDDKASWSVPHFKEKVIEYVLPASTHGGQLTREEALFNNRIAPPGEKALPRGAAWEMADVPDEAYADGRVAAEVCKRLVAAKKSNNSSFFIAVGMARPHLPFSVPKKYWDLYDPEKLPLPQRETAPDHAPLEAQKRDGEIAAYDPIPKQTAAPFSLEIKRKLIHGYYAATSYTDAQIGKIMDCLKSTGLDKNTIVILWGDHGFHLGELGIWTKHVNYEMANHIPLIIHAPGITQAHSHTAQLTETVDIFPTLTDLCGLPQPTGPQPIDGLSLVPVLKDGTARVRDHAYHCFRRERLGRAIRTDRYRLVEWWAKNQPKSSATYELYDYKDGPVETKNISADHPDIVKKLRAILARHPKPL